MTRQINITKTKTIQNDYSDPRVHVHVHEPPTHERVHEPPPTDARRHVVLVNTHYTFAYSLQIYTQYYYYYYTAD